MFVKIFIEEIHAFQTAQQAQTSQNLISFVIRIDHHWTLLE
jgi:hypothetical protein